MTHKILKTEVVYKAHAFNVLRDQVQFPSGKVHAMDIVVHTGAVAMVPIDSDGNIVLVRQYRHSAKKALLELPAGTLKKGEDPEACAQRELREEIGMAPGSLIKLADFFLAPGYSTERMWIYLARDLKPERLPGDEDEDLTIEIMSVEQAFAAVKSGQIEDAKTILGVFLAGEVLSGK
ncbi:MAG: NUDIX hydrolase [Anaerolineales bacterium]